MKGLVAAKWGYKSLGELTDKIGSGATPRGGKESYKESGVSLIRSLNIHDLEFRYANLARIDDAQAAALANVDVEARDVLLNITGASIARCTQVPQDVLPARVNQHVAILRPKNDILDSRFLSYLLVAKETKDQLLTIGDKAGATRQALTKEQLQNFHIPLPIIEEQKRIVAVLDQAFAALDRARAHAEANRKSSRELFGTLLEVTLRRDASDWERRSLKSLGTTQTGTTPKASEAESYGDFIPFIKPGDFKLDGSLELGNQGLSALGAKKARTVPAGSVLMVCIGATIGKAGFTETEIVTNQQINAVFPRDGISGEFLYYQFITPSFQREVMRRSGQATLPIINKSKWSEIEVAFPSDLATQAHIVESLRAIRRQTEELVGRYDQKIADLANLRQSLLQKAFSGELT